MGRVAWVCLYIWASVRACCERLRLYYQENHCINILLWIFAIQENF
uniref:Uncharacterized protein n=1 Tax=Setaria viridis TaxID=4556 RepID=A0A4U6VSP0_SETVI|nr:hypothetical protein SEVIR_2G159518v2 [Setaria viridis]